ncbi:MAG: permease prefix domain 1-containing protein [Trueperaceae bacterium]
MSPVDQYVRRATTGLPNRTRLDTAAELRVHLNERITQYVAQGFDRAEAEHLAVEQMGPAEPVNRRFLGHVFTPRVGWVVLGLLVVASGGWLAGNYLFAPAPTVKNVAVKAEELIPFIGDFQMLQLTLPKRTKALHIAITLGEDGATLSGTNLEHRYPDLRPNQRVSIPLGVGFLHTALASTECGAGNRALVTFGSDHGRSEMCVPMPSEVGSWTFLMQNADNVMVQDVWQPLLLYKPSVMVDEVPPGTRSSWSTPEGHAIVGPRDTWIAVSAFASTAPLNDGDPQAEYPTIGDVVRQYRWVEF